MARKKRRADAPVDQPDDQGQGPAPERRRRVDRKAKTTVSLPEEMVRQVGHLAIERGLDRCAIFEAALAQYMRRYPWLVRIGSAEVEESPADPAQDDGGDGATLPKGKTWQEPPEPKVSPPPSRGGEGNPFRGG